MVFGIHFASVSSKIDCQAACPVVWRLHWLRCLLWEKYICIYIHRRGAVNMAAHHLYVYTCIHDTHIESVRTATHPPCANLINLGRLSRGNLGIALRVGSKG